MHNKHFCRNYFIEKFPSFDIVDYTLLGVAEEINHIDIPSYYYEYLQMFGLFVR